MHLTQEELAYLAGISPKYLQQIEDGSSQPTAYVLAGLAAALEFPVESLLGNAATSPRRKPKASRNTRESAAITKLLTNAPPEKARLALRLVKDVLRFKPLKGKNKK